MDTNNESHTSTENEAMSSTRKISKYKSTASQIYVVFAMNLVRIADGMYSGFSSVLLAELHKPDAEITMSVDDLSWFSSRYFMTPIGCLLAGVIAQKIGNRTAVLTSSLLSVLFCLAFYFAKSATVLLAAQAFSGLILPLAAGPVITYTVEIAEPQFRSSLVAVATLSSISGAFFAILLSNFFHWRTLILVILALLIVGFIAAYTIPESPHWLAGKGKLDEAQRALAWVRGWTKPNNVKSEFEKMKETYENSSTFIENFSKTRWDLKTWSYLIDTCRPFLQKSFYIPLASVSFMFFLRDMAGAHILSTFFIVIFREIKSPIHPNIAGSIFDGARVFGAIVYMMLINRIGKKIMAYISIMMASISYFTISAALFSREYGISPDVCQWIATITIIISTFSTAAGIDKIIVMLNAELFPAKLRSVGFGIGLFVFAVIGAISNKLFLYALDFLTMPGIFMMFGIACLGSLFMFYVIFPETEGRTLKEIEEHYSGVKKLKE